jgi:hypothetical protein
VMSIHINAESSATTTRGVLAKAGVWAVMTGAGRVIGRPVGE